MRTRVLLAALVLGAGAAAGVGIGRYQENAVAGSSRSALDSGVVAALEEAFVEAGELAKKSVVHITGRSGGDRRGMGVLTQAENIGSGVVVDTEGHVLTNHHVVRAARQLFVQFVDGSEYDAQVVGVDPSTDLALLKIDVPETATLVPVVFSDSDKVRVGHWVLAVGSPFGYNHTVTSGIISARHRTVGLNLAYQDFLQTDAAVNPGNSGGALVNLKGELVGINSAIVSGSQASDGVGFAIPSNLAKWVTEALRREGRVRRGSLGVKVSDINEQLVHELDAADLRTLGELLTDLGLDAPRGAFVFEVVPGSAAEKAGLKFGDVVVALDDRIIQNRTELVFRIAEAGPDRTVEIRYLRNGTERTATCTLGERKD